MMQKATHTATTTDSTMASLDLRLRIAFMIPFMSGNLAPACVGKGCGGLTHTTALLRTWLTTGLRWPHLPP